MNGKYVRPNGSADGGLFIDVFPQLTDVRVFLDQTAKEKRRKSLSSVADQRQQPVEQRRCTISTLETEEEERVSGISKKQDRRRSTALETEESVPIMTKKQRRPTMSAQEEEEPVIFLNDEQYVFQKDLKRLYMGVGYTVKPGIGLKQDYHFSMPGIFKRLMAPGNNFASPSLFKEHLKTCALLPFLQHVATKTQHSSLDKALDRLMPLLRLQGRFSEEYLLDRLHASEQSSADRLQKLCHLVGEEMGADQPMEVVTAVPCATVPEEEETKTNERYEDTQLLDDDDDALEETQVFEEEMCQETQPLDDGMPDDETLDDTQPIERTLDWAAPMEALDDLRKRLADTFVPSNFLCREAEAKQIDNFLEQSRSKTEGKCLYICGPPGTGKTAVVNTFRAKWGAEKTLQVHSMNAMTLIRSKSFLSSLVQELLQQKELDVKKCVHLLRKATKQRRMVLIIDELDCLFDRKEYAQDLRLLAGWAESSNLLLIGIANTIDTIETKVHFDPNYSIKTVVFSPYTFDQLDVILNARIQQHATFKNSTINLCARKVAANSGDVREALGLCRRVLEEANQNVEAKVTLQMMAKHSNALYQKTTLKDARMGRLSKMILFAALDIATRNPIIATIREVYVGFENKCFRCDYQNNASDRAKFLSALKELQQLTIVKFSAVDRDWKNKVTFIHSVQQIKAFLQQDIFFMRYL